MSISGKSGNFTVLLILHVINISSTQIYFSGIEKLPWVNDTGGILRGVNPLDFVTLNQEALLMSHILLICMDKLWGRKIAVLSPQVCFQVE